MGRPNEIGTQVVLKAIRYELKKIFGEHQVKEIMAIIKSRMK